MKVYYYPPAGKFGYKNPYSVNFKSVLEKKFELLDKDNKKTIMQGLSFLKHSFIADIYILNWLEGIYFRRLGFLQFVFAIIGLRVIKIRKKKIIWMYHNIRPHEGSNIFSETIRNKLLKQASLIITHSSDAANFVKKISNSHIEYICHPIKKYEINIEGKELHPCDFFIWGDIVKYKGIVEFSDFFIKSRVKKKLVIIGRCSDEDILEKLNSIKENNIVYENRRANFDEISAYCKIAKYVLFPYTGESVSSSGAMIDTLAFGGYPLGPNRGAFKDLSMEKLCDVYNNEDELKQFIENPQKNNSEIIEKFIKENSWENFGIYISEKVIRLNKD
jgi:beta-1,4-mannosyltransferase